MSGDEILQHVQSFAEVGGDRSLDNLTRGFRHQASHAGKLSNLLLGPAGTRVGHHVDGVEVLALGVLFLHGAEHFVRDAVGDVRPDGDHLVVTFAVGDGAFLVLTVDLDHLFFGLADQHFLVERNDHVIDADRDAGLGGVKEPEVLQRIEHLDRGLDPEAQVAVVHHLGLPLLAEQTVGEGHSFGKLRVEDDPAHRGVDEMVLHGNGFGVEYVLVVVGSGEVDHTARKAQLDHRLRFHLADFQRQDDFFGRSEQTPLAEGPGLFLGQVVAAQHDVLAGNRQRLTVCRRKDVVRAEHQHRSLGLSLR